MHHSRYMHQAKWFGYALAFISAYFITGKCFFIWDVEVVEPAKQGASLMAAKAMEDAGRGGVTGLMCTTGWPTCFLPIHPAVAGW